MSIKIFFDEWFHHIPNLILNKWGKTPVHHLSILEIELGSLGCTTACPTTEPRLSLQPVLVVGHSSPHAVSKSRKRRNEGVKEY